MDKYQKESQRISNELKQLSLLYKSQNLNDYHNKARCEINKKYGKGWREALDIKSAQEFPENHKDRFSNMSHY
jgi:hypothetical protein